MDKARIKRKLMMIIGLAYDLQELTGAESFVRYSGHVNYIDVEVYRCGWEENQTAYYKAELIKATEENLDKIIKDLNEVYYKLHGGEGDF